MNSQFLPHYFKYIAIVIFILGAPYYINSSIQGWVAGTNSTGGSSEITFIFPSLWSIQIHHVITLLSYLIYALSKDRVMDEYFIKIRMESISLIFFGSLTFILTRVIIRSDWEMSAMYFFEAQIVFYFVYNKLRKMTLAGS
jgi:hypothetical protein